MHLLDILWPNSIRISNKHEAKAEIELHYFDKLETSNIYDKINAT